MRPPLVSPAGHAPWGLFWHLMHPNLMIIGGQGPRQGEGALATRTGGAVGAPGPRFLEAPAPDLLVIPLLHGVKRVCCSEKGVGDRDKAQGLTHFSSGRPRGGGEP
jgi:hypothetical protein